MEAVPSSIEAARWREYHQRNPMKKQHKVMPLFHQTVHKSIMQQKNLKRNNQSAKNDTIPLPKIFQPLLGGHKKENESGQSA